jgi:hypothetical protein
MVGAAGLSGLGMDGSEAARQKTDRPAPLHRPAMELSAADVVQVRRGLVGLSRTDGLAERGLQW